MSEMENNLKETSLAEMARILADQKKAYLDEGNVLYQLSEIAEAAIIGVPDAKWGETGKAVVVLKSDQSLDEEKIIAHCLEKLAKFKVPASVEFIDALPRNATGKVLKRSLREMFVDEATPAIT